uniref:Uncharacterized protein n=1 Tax=Panagrolaimus superbus TaxID=310955 RepID=A0A914YAF5_9BILA
MNLDRSVHERPNFIYHNFPTGILKTNKYCSKNYYYNLKGYTYRTKLAVLHYNHNILDEESGKRKNVGTKKYRYRAKHRDDEFVTKQRKTPPDFQWKRHILAQSRQYLPTWEPPKNPDGEEQYESEMSDSENEDGTLNENVRAMILNAMGLEDEYEESDSEEK